MQLIGLEAIYRRPNTSKPTPGHKAYPRRVDHLMDPRIGDLDNPQRDQSHVSTKHTQGRQVLLEVHR